MVGKEKQKRDKREKRKTQGQTTSEKVKAKKKKNLHDACSTALRIVQLYLKNTNWLKHRVLEQKPKL